MTSNPPGTRTAGWYKIRGPFSNWRQAIELKVAPEQERFVASNAASLAQAAYSGEDWHPHTVYAGEKMVGFIMWLHTEHEGRPVFFIARLMVADGLQGH